mgnify:CR=1 FL=1
MTLIRMDNVGIVVESLDSAISFFTELGLKLEGRATVEGEWAGRVTGLGSTRFRLAMMLTPDAHRRDDIDETLARLYKRGAQLVGEVVQYEASYRLCYIRGPEGLLIGLAQALGV